MILNSRNCSLKGELISINVNCKCGKKLSVPDSLEGKKVKCPNCQHVLTVKKEKPPQEPPPQEEPKSQVGQSPGLELIEPDIKSKPVTKPSATEVSKPYRSRASTGKPDAWKENILAKSIARWKDYSGRSTRSEMWYFSLFVILSVVPFMGVLLLISLIPIEAIMAILTIAVLLAFVVYSIAVLLATIALQVRRMHDLNLSALWLLLLLMPILNGIISLAEFVFLYFIRGSIGGNKFGPDPRGIVRQDEKMGQIARLGELWKKGVIPEDYFLKEKELTFAGNRALHYSSYARNSDKLIQFKSMLDDNILTEDEYTKQRDILL